MRIDQITVEVRSLALGRLGQIDDGYLTDLKLIKRFNNVGSWSMSLPVELGMAQELAQPGRGIVVQGPNGILMSGPMVSVVHDQDSDDPVGTWTFQGTDDNVFLADALAFPLPTQASVSLQTDSHDVRTGNAETVLRAYVNANIGASAPASRRIAGVTLATNLNRGATVTGRARFDKLGVLLSDVASVGGVGFDMQQVGTTIVFTVYVPQDRTGTVRMDIDNDLLESAQYGFGAPTGTRAIVAGQGQQEDRRFIQITDALATAAETAWGRKIEVFKDRRDTPDDAELTQEGTDIVTSNGRTTTSLKVKPADDTTMVYGVDWFLGDIVQVVVDDQPLQAVVTESIISITEDGVEVGATIGDPTGFDYEAKLIAQQQDQEQRLAFLEKNAETVPADQLYTRADLNGGQLDTRYYTEAEIDALFVAKRAGLVPIAPTSVAVVAGSASIVGNRVLLNAAAQVQLRGLFTSAYRRYVLIYRLPTIAGTANWFFGRFITGTGVVTAANYYGGYQSNQAGNVNDVVTNPTSPATHGVIGYGTLASGVRSGVFGVLEIDNPLGGINGGSADESASFWSDFTYSTVNHTRIRSRWTYNGAPSFDGFIVSNLTGTTTYTGEIACYAYA